MENNEKAILLVRTSTIQQEIDSQTKEVSEYAIRKGFKEENLIIVGARGASAVKMDERFQANINQVKALIEADKSITSIIVWSIDRIGRREAFLMAFRDYLIEHHIQLYIMKPELQLMNSDGQIDSGTFISFAIFSTMAKLSADDIKDKTRRGREYLRKELKHWGGKVPWAYGVSDERFFVIVEEKAEFIRKATELYATGEYSYTTLAEALSGEYPEEYINNIYNVFQGIHNYDGTKPQYPPIITAERSKLIKSIQTRNSKSKGKGSKHYFLLNKLIKCDCGHYFQRNGEVYVCKHCMSLKQRKPQVKVTYIESIIINLVSKALVEHWADNARTKAIDNTDRIVKLKVRIDNLKSQNKKLDRKIVKLTDKELDGLITPSQYKELVNKYKSEFVKNENSIKELELNINELNEQMKLSINPNPTGTTISRNVERYIPQLSERQAYDLVHQFINYITIVQNPKLEREYIITVVFKSGKRVEFAYTKHTRSLPQAIRIRNQKFFLGFVVNRAKNGDNFSIATI